MSLKGFCVFKWVINNRNPSWYNKWGSVWLHLLPKLLESGVIVFFVCELVCEEQLVQMKIVLKPKCMKNAWINWNSLALNAETFKMQVIPRWSISCMKKVRIIVELWRAKNLQFIQQVTTKVTSAWYNEKGSRPVSKQQINPIDLFLDWWLNSHK